MPQTEIQKLINAVDAKTMGKIDKVLKGMTKKTEGEESPGDMAKAKKAKMAKDAGADNQVTDNGVSHAHTPMSDRAQAALKAMARIAAPFKDEITADHVGAVMNEVGISSPMSDEATPADDDEGKGMMGKVEMNLALPDGVEETHHSEALDMAQKSYMGHLEKMGYRKYPDPSLDSANGNNVGKDADMEDEEEEEEESVNKVQKSAAGALDLSSFPTGQRAQLEAIFKAHNTLVQENKELVKKTATLESQLKEERDHRVLKGFEEKAKAFKHLGADSKELAVVMKSLAESDPTSYEKVEAILKSADNQISAANKHGGAGLYGEIGSRQGRASGGNSAEDKLNALVDTVVSKSDGKTHAEVYTEVLKTAEGKRLYAEFKASRKDGI